MHIIISAEQLKEELENAFKALASDVAKSNSEEFLKLANDKFENLKNQSDNTLEQKKKLSESQKLTKVEQQTQRMFG